MKTFLLALLCALLSACCTTAKLVQPEPVVVKQTEYVIRIPPAELMTLPAPVPNINVDKATQGDVAAWLIASEKRVKELEAQLIGIAQFFGAQQVQLDSTAKKVNAQSLQVGVDQTKANAVAVDAKSVDTSATVK